MSYTFKRNIFGFMDLLRFKKMVPARRKIFDNGSAAPLQETYRVNETAAVLHPGYQTAVLEKIESRTSDTKTFTFALSKPVFFRAGQYVTVGCLVDGSEVSRPYAVTSAPLQGLERELTVTVKKCGFFSSYLFDRAKTGDSFIIGDPSGEFYYEGLKDAPQVVALAGGSGITPFYSMAQAIRDGTEDFSLTVIYGARTEQDLIFKKELDALGDNRIRVVYVLSDETKDGYESGFITKDLILRTVHGDFTVMMCGPEPMYRHLEKELEPLNLPAKRIKKEANCVGIRDVPDKTFSLTVTTGDSTVTVPAVAGETLLVAMERAGLKVPARCRAGGCGFCHSRLISGDFTIAGNDKRRLADKKFGYIHPCCSYPDSDMALEVPPCP